MNTKRISISLLAVVLVLLLGTVGVLAAGDVNVEVADRYGFAQATLDDGTIIQYIGDLNTTYGPSGSGVFDSFVRLQADGTERGYNTDGTREFDTKAGNFTHSIKLSQIPAVFIGGQLYWEFWSDINDSDSTPLISLDDFELYLTSDPNLTGYPFSGTATMIYDYTDANDNYSVLINDVNQGSGRGDLRYLVPVPSSGLPGNCNYGNPSCATYLVLYSEWGGKGGAYTSDGGFEEWKVKKYPILQVSKTINGAYDTPVSWTITKDYDATYDLFTGETQTHAYQVSVVPTLGAPANTMVSGAITILGDPKNAINANIADKFNGLDATITSCSVPQNGDGTYTIAKNATVTCSYELSLGAPVNGDNIARASYTVSGVMVAFEGKASILAADYVETLTGNPTIDVSDTNGKAWSTALPPAINTWTYTKTFTCDGDEGTHVNTATITQTGQSDTATVIINCYAPVVTKTAEAFYSRYFEWDITKSVTPANWDLFSGESGTSDYTVFLDQTGFYENDWQVSGKITIANPHPSRDAELTQVVDDAGGIPGVVDCPSLTVPAGGSLVCTYDTGAQDSVDANPFGDTNTATATQQLYDFASDGTPTVDGTKDYSGTAAIDFAGATVTLVDDQATVSDTYAGSPVSGTFSGDHTFTYSRTFTCDGDEGQHDNTASFLTNDTPLSGSDSASVTVNCFDLSVSKTADEFYTRYYEWMIDKSVDNPGPITVPSGGSIDLHYTVIADVLSFTDNDWQVNGDIKIENNHPSQAADLTQVVDDAGGITGVVDCPSLTVPAGGSLICTYGTGAQDSANSNPFGNTNTATVTQQLYDFASDGTPTADGTKDYSGTAPIDFSGADVSYVDETVDVTDDYAGFLGTCTAGTAPCTFTYTRTVPVDGLFCGTFTVDNTATFTTNDTGATGSDSVSVSIEVPCLGCTPGFWQGGAGALLWDEIGDQQWVYGGTNPFIHTTLFNDFFNDAGDVNGNGLVDVDPQLDGFSMMDLVGSGGGANWAEKAARDMVAAYLNESAFPDSFPAASLNDLLIMWYNAVAGGDSGYQAFHDLVSGWNSPPDPGYCPLP
jgi:hypothetical protein